MSTASLQSRVNTRSIKKLEKPRPLKLNVSQSRSDIRLSSGISLDEVMSLADSVCQLLTNGGCDDRAMQASVLALSGSLKLYGQQLEAVYKDQLDRVFVTLRNGSRDERVDYVSRLHLLELIELRGAQWAGSDNATDYYRHKAAHTYQHSLSAEEIVPVMESPVTPTGTLSGGSLSALNLGLHGPLGALGLTAASVPSTPQPAVLSPGEVLKTSGKFSKPTKIPNKNYCKDEVVIRNSDSGKVSPGAKERLVQITGPSEEKIIHARQLMEDTIRRNASPVRPELPDRDVQREALGGSSSSLNSSASDDSSRMPHTGARHSTLLHSFSTNDAHLGEYKYTVAVGGCVLKITGSNHDLVRAAKLFLDEYFANQDLSYINSYEEELPSPPSSAPATVTNAPVNMSQAAAATAAAAAAPATGSLDSSTSESDETIKTAAANNAGVPGTPAAAFVEEGSELDNVVRSSVRRLLIADNEEADSKVDAGVVAIVRQPLFPHSSKAAFEKAAESTRFADAMATLRRSYFARNAAAQRKAANLGAQDGGRPGDAPSGDAASGGFFSLACAHSNSLGGRRNNGTNSIFPPKFEFGGNIAPPSVKNPLVNGGSSSLRYSLDTLLKLSESSLSRGEPQDWSRISRDFPTIVKKAVEPFNPNEYRRAADREYPVAVVPADETGSPDPE